MVEVEGGSSGEWEFVYLFIRGHDPELTYPTLWECESRVGE